MKTSTTGLRWTGLKLKLVMGALLVGITGIQVGCGCECATAAAVAALATPVVFLAREAQEARKTQLEIEWQEVERRPKAKSPSIEWTPFVRELQADISTQR